MFISRLPLGNADAVSRIVSMMKLLRRIQYLDSVTNLRLLACIYLAELSLVIVPMAIHMKGERPFAVFVFSRPGLVFLLAVTIFLMTTGLILREYWMSRGSRTSHFRLIVAMNVASVLLLAITAEITLRMIAESSKEGEIVWRTALKPKNWEKVALRYRQLVDRGSNHLPYLDYDDVMGWTVGPNRRSADGLYQSSSEGIRSAQAGIHFSESTGKTRIALVGDSYTFANEVPYEDSWGYRLQEALGPNFQVLNFGVGGYSVGQAYLRYEKDVRKWEPQIVIFSFIWHDLIRTLTVYPFLAFPDWEFPFSKPRFILRDGDLALVNVPPLAPEAIFSRRSIFELPYLEYDIGFKEDDWMKSLKQVSYMARLFVSSVPRWLNEKPHLAEQSLVSVNASILRTFVRSVAEKGAIPIVVYLPSGKEVEAERQSSPQPLTEQVLKEAGVGYTDITSCLSEVDPMDRLASDHTHYSRQGNAAVANCLHSVIDEKLAVPSVEG